MTSSKVSRTAPFGAIGLLVAALAAACAGCGRSGPETLHVVWGSDVLSLDPNSQFEFATDTVAMNVFEPLLRFDRRLSFSPVLAESWDIADKRRWRFRLREGITFHDGTPLTSADVVFTIERVRASARSDLKPFLAGIRSVEAPDDWTVDVVSDRPADLLPALSFVYVLPKKALSERGEKAFFERPIGTGPYRFVEWTPQTRVVLERYEGHRDEAPAFGRVVFAYARSSEEMWRTAKERSPAIVLNPGRKSWNEHAKDPDFVLLSRPGLTVEFLSCNMKPGKPLADVRVRRALRAAIDTAALAKKVSGGEAFAASQLVTSDIFGYDPKLAVPAYDPALAKRLLTEAGHPRGIDLTLNSGEGPAPMLEEIIRQLGLAGIRVKRQDVPEEEFFRRLHECEGDLHVSGWFCSTGDASELLVGSFTPGKDRARPTECGYASPALDELVDTAARTLDPGVRRGLLQKSMRLLVDDLPWIPLLVPYDRYAMTRGLAWEPRADGEVFAPEVGRKR